jgi:hypothetical protein
MFYVPCIAIQLWNVDQQNALFSKCFNPLQKWGETVISPGLTFTDSPFCPRNVFICFVWLQIQTAFVSVHSIYWLACIKQTACLLRGTNWTFKCNVSYCNLCTVHFYIVFINNQHIQLLTVLLLHSTAPTCFDARASSSGSFLCLHLLVIYKYNIKNARLKS